MTPLGGGAQRDGPRSLLIAYGLMQHPLRSTVSDHLYAFREHSRARCFYVNLMLGPAPSWLLRRRYDAVIFHTSLLSSIRWAPSLEDELIERSRAVSATASVRLAMPQDEFLRTDTLNRFIRACLVDVVCSVAPPSEWPKIYAGVDPERVRFEHVLTGYLSERTVARIDQILATRAERPVDVSYRAGAPRPYLGSHGMLKTDIAAAAAPVVAAHELRGDISVEGGDVLLGDDWFRHLARSRWTLGVEGGASLLDHDGSVRERVTAYLGDQSDASYQEVEAACFPGRDGDLALFALSPRHLEACATRTGQVLVEGDYNGVLEAGVHYLPLRRDLSNLSATVGAMRDEDLRQRLTDAAHRDVVASGRYTYAGFVARIEGTLSAGAPARRSPAQRATLAVLERAARALDRVSWLRVAYRLKGRRRVQRALGLVAAPLAGLGRRGRRRGHRAVDEHRTDSPRPTAVSVTPARLDADSRTLKEAVSLARLGFRSVVVEGAPSQSSFPGLPIEVLTMPPLPGARLPSRLAWVALGPLMRLMRPLSVLVALNRAAHRLVPAAQLYWLHGAALFPAVGLRASRNGAPLVYDAHDFYPDAARGPERLPREIRRSLWLDRQVERLCVRVAAARVTVGAGVAALQEEHFGGSFLVLHNAHDPRLDSPVSRDLRQTLGLDASAFLIAVVGNGKPGTAVEPALEAMTRLPDRVHLAFLGRGHEDLRRAATQRGLDTRVHVLAPVAPDEVTAFTASADAAAILYFPLTTNFLNALPNRLYQAVAAGLPLLYPDQMLAIRDLAQRLGLGVAMDPRQAGSIAAAVDSMLQDPERLARTRERVEAAAEKLNWEREEARMATLVATVLPEGSASRP